MERDKEFYLKLVIWILMLLILLKLLSRYAL